MRDSETGGPRLSGSLASIGYADGMTLRDYFDGNRL